MSDTNELTPPPWLRYCQHCGNFAILEGRDLAWTVTCEGCGMQTAVRNRVDQAVANWNATYLGPVDPLTADDATVERVARALVREIMVRHYGTEWRPGELDTRIENYWRWNIPAARAAIAAMGGADV